MFIIGKEAKEQTLIHYSRAINIINCYLEICNDTGTSTQSFIFQSTLRRLFFLIAIESGYYVVI